MLSISVQEALSKSVKVSSWILLLGTFDALVLSAYNNFNGNISLNEMYP